MRARFELEASADALADAIGKWRRPQAYRRAIAFLAIAALLAATGAIVYATGGTRYAYLHLAYIPIIFGAVFFGMRGSIATAIAATVVVGPWMPLNVAQGLPQPVTSWGTRGILFIVIGFITGFLLELLNVENKAIRRFAYYDPQTQLPNQVALLSDLRQQLDRSNNELSLILIELGRFTQLRATFGLERLETLLTDAARRLQASISGDDKLYIVRPFQLAIVRRSGAPDVQSLINALRTPTECDGIAVDLEARAGAAWAPEHGATADELMKAAATALYRAHRGRDAAVIFDQRICAQQLKAFRLVSELRQALRNNELQLHYQPKVDLVTGRCVAAEALLRWQHKEHGFVPPGEFIGYVEQTMLIDDLTRWVIDAAVRQAALWHGVQPPLAIAVNLSARNLDDDQLTADISQMLQEHAVSSGSLQVEITETAIMRDTARSGRILEELKRIGVGIAIDDFGTGQSSLAYLASLPVDEIKVDRALVAQIIDHPKFDHIVCSAIELGHRLGKTVTAEGIETQPVAERLKSYGCDLAQGYFFACPMPPGEFEAWLQENHTTTRVETPSYAAPAT